MKCNKWRAGGITSALCVVGIVITYFAWPRANQKNKVDVDGDRNEIETNERQEVSLVHIEGLKSAQRASNWASFFGFVAVLGIGGYAVFHHRVIRNPRRTRKNMDRERMLDRLHDIEEVLVELGHMRKKRKLRNKRRNTKKMKGKKTKKNTKHEIEEEDEEEEDEV